MATAPVVAIGVRPGYATATTCKMLVASLTGGVITVNCNGVNYVSGTDFTIAQVGTDNAGTAAQAGWTGTLTITGLSAFTRYTYTVTQASNSGSTTGQFMTAPNATSDFSFFFSGCDNGLPGAGVNTGFWNKVRDYVTNGALPTVGHLFVDDHGYVAEMFVDDTASAGGTGVHKTSGTTTYINAKVYDYALGYIAALGMLDNTTNVPIGFGRNDDRRWCNQNLNYIPQWGDHEFLNDIGWDFPSDATETLGNYGSLFTGSVATAATAFANGKTAWDAFHLGLQPPSRGASGSIAVLDVTSGAGNTGANAAVGANHWGFTWGCVNIVAPDGITHADGQWNHGLGAAGTLNGKYPGTLYGSNQIKDCLTFLNTTSKQPFNILAMCFGIRNLDGNTESATGNGTQHPIDHVNSTPFTTGGTGTVGSFLETAGNNATPGSEYQQLFTKTGNAVKSIMDDVQTKGVAGCTVTLHGDYHRQMVTHNVKAAYTGNAAENFYSVWNGTTNGSTNFNFAHSTASNGNTIAGGALTTGTLYSYGGTDLVYNSLWTNVARRWSGLRVDVYGSRSTREMHVILMDESGAEMWHGRWLERSSNEIFPTTWVNPKRAISKSL